MLYLLVSGQARTRQQVASLLGVSRNTVGHWLASYEMGGFQPYSPSTSHLVNPCHLHRTCLPVSNVPCNNQRALPRTKICASGSSTRITFASIAKTLYTIVHTKFKAKLKVPCPSHIKKADAAQLFQATYADQLRAVCRTTDQRPVKVFAQDEGRIGLLTVRRRRLTARGVQPVGLIQHTFQSL